MATNKPKHILIAPLDWGLGHTTRCVPIIRCILRLGHIPVVAGNASQRSFIEETFGNIDIIHLEGYNISYSRWNKLAQAGLISQLPHINKTIRKEHQWLLKLAATRKIDGIISDNRYGLYHPEIPSVILTHQLEVQTGMGNIANQLIRKIHYRYLERFNEVWIPDVAGITNLGGKLSHPAVMPRNSIYLGLLSRFETGATTQSKDSDLLILLSGPEPQRSDISRVLWEQVLNYKGKVTFIEGREDVVPKSGIPPNIAYHKRLTHSQLAPLLEDCSMIICRSGYSTLMDIIALGKKAIVVPTPGQTEQEYLGAYLHERGICLCAKQNGFELQKSIDQARAFPYHFPDFGKHFHIHEQIIADWTNSL